MVEGLVEALVTCEHLLAGKSLNENFKWNFSFLVLRSGKGLKKSKNGLEILHTSQPILIYQNSHLG